jgi:hypothetical protein
MHATQSIRRRSSKTLFGLPLLDIAIGPDPAKGQVRGHARGIIAIGDIATGWLAIGGIACGIVAVGGLAAGGLCIAGVGIGLAVLGGVAAGGLAFGGVAVAAVALGGCAIGYYATGGFALGKHIVTDLHRDPQALQFFDGWVPWL